MKGENEKFIYYESQKIEINEITKNTGNSFNIKVDGNTVLIREDATVLKTTHNDYVQDGIYYQDINENTELSDNELFKSNNSIKDLIQE